MMRGAGDVLLIACYELGHQPLAVAWPAAALEAAGYAPAVLDVSVEGFDADRARRARLVAISVPMHTALRLGVRVAARVREVNPDCHVAFYGLYATLNAAYQRHFGFDLMNRSLDTMDLTLHLERSGAFTDPERIREFTLDSLCEMFDVIPHDRHTASGDAFITAQVFQRLLRLAPRFGRAQLGALCEPFHHEGQEDLDPDGRARRTF